MLLIVLKVLSDLLTAASGVFGLLTEFKDQYKTITPSGKVALSGIVIGFALSGVIAVLEARNATEERKEHEQEVARLGRPLDDHMGALIVLSVPKDADRAERYRPQLTAYFKNLIAHHVKPDPSLPIFAPVSRASELKSFVTDYRHLPAKFRDKGSEMNEIFDRSIEYSLQLFRSATCESLIRERKKPDLELGFGNISLESDPSVRWEYIADDDFLAMSRGLKLWVVQGTNRFTSIGDFPGSTMVAWLGSADRDYKLEYLEISLRGASIQASDFTPILGGGGCTIRASSKRRKAGWPPISRLLL